MYKHTSASSVAMTFPRSPSSPFAKTPTSTTSPVGSRISPRRWATPEHVGKTLRNAMPPTTTVLVPGEESYETERTACWNADVVHKPACICQPTTTAEVCEVVKFASRRREKLVLAGGRHGHDCMEDDALVLDMSKMKAVAVDAEQMTVTVEGGARLGDMDQACKPLGLACVTGTNPDTGVCGLSMAGGGGYMSRLYGMACDNFVSAEVVLADGTAVLATKDNEHAELLWAVAGAGSNMGVVTRLTMRAHKMDRVFGGLTINTALQKSTAAEIVGNWRDWLLAAPRSVASVAVLPCGAPVVPMISVELDQEKVPQQPEAAAKTGLACSPALQQAFGKLGAFGSNLSIKMLKPMQYHSELQPALEQMQQPGHYFDASVIVPELSEAVIATLVKYTRELHPNSQAAVIVFPLSGAVADAAVDSAAFYGGGRRPRGFWIIIEGKFEPDKRAPVVAWVKALKAALGTFGVSETAHTLDGNMTQDASAAQQMGAIFGPNTRRVREVKAKYDPTNFFTCNRNITPLGADE